MTVKVFLRGGLGNQLFQYAAGLYLARKQNESLVLRHDLLPDKWDSISGIPRCPVQLDDFRFDGTLARRNIQPEGKTHFLSKLLQLQRMLADRFPSFFLRLGILAGDSSYPPDFAQLNRIRTVNAYCSSPIPAIGLGESLRRQMRAVVEPSPKFVELAKQASETSPIMLHIRLGDYLNLSKLYGTADYGAISLEVARVKAKKSNPVWLFTDSPSDISVSDLQMLGVTKVIGPETLESPIENLVLLAAGSHLITANSTFSWWAAFLKGEGDQVSIPNDSRSEHTVFSHSMRLKGWVPYGKN
jgi:hypothetical protein